MPKLSNHAETILHAVTLRQYDVPYQACPASIDQIKADAATVLWAAALVLRTKYLNKEHVNDFSDFLLSISSELKQNNSVSRTTTDD